MIRTQIQLSDRQFRALKNLAAEAGVSMAELIRRSVDDFLQSRSAREPGELKQRALGAAGRHRSGLSDLSETHDRHLGEVLGE